MNNNFCLYSECGISLKGRRSDAIYCCLKHKSDHYAEKLRAEQEAERLLAEGGAVGEEIVVPEIEIPTQLAEGGPVNIHDTAVFDELSKAESDLDKAVKSQGLMKKANAIIKSKKDVEGRLQKELNLSEKNIYDLVNPDRYGRTGFASYSLTNNNANIKRLRERVAMLTKKYDALKSDKKEAYTFDGGRIEVNYPLDRVQIFFDEKPDGDTRTKMKSSGWNWSPTNGAWQRKNTPDALFSAKRMFNAVGDVDNTINETVAPVRTYTVDDITDRNFTLINLSATKAYTKQVPDDATAKNALSNLYARFIVFSSDRNIVDATIKSYFKKHLPDIDLSKANIASYPHTYVNDAKKLLAIGHYLPKPDTAAPGKTLFPLYNNYRFLEDYTAEAPAAEPVIEQVTELPFPELEPAHPLNILDPESSQYKSSLKEYNESKEPPAKVKIKSEEILEPNTPEEWDEAIMDGIDPHDNWVGDLIKERAVKQQIYQQINGSEDDKAKEVERIFQLYAKKTNPELTVHEEHQPKASASNLIPTDFEKFYNNPEKHYSNPNWKSKFEESANDLIKIKTTLLSLKEFLESKYPGFIWQIEPYNDVYSFFTIGYRITFKTEGVLANKFIAYQIRYKTIRVNDYSNAMQVDSRDNEPFLLEIYFYPEVEIYGSLSKDQNPTIRENSSTLFSLIDIENLLVDMDKEFSYLKDFPQAKATKKPSTPAAAETHSEIHSKTDFQGINHNYQNQYVLNKAIEALLQQKGISSSDYTSDEKAFLRKYSGYGGLDKYGKTGKGGLFEYYTPADVIKKMWALAYKYGYNNGSVLEPSVGTGEFLQFLKPGIRCVGYDISSFSAQICKILYPNVEVLTQPFEQTFIKNNWTIKDNTTNMEKFDLVIGNPSYGDFSIVESRYMSGMGEKDHVKPTNYVEYFLRRSIDLLNPGGLLVFIVGSQLKAGGVLFLDSGPSTVKEYLAQHCEMLDAYQLPDSIFERTGVTSDIIVLKKL